MDSPEDSTADSTKRNGLWEIVWSRRSTILPIVALLVIVIYFGIASPVFLSKNNMFNILRQSAILMIVAGGATFIILQGSIDLSAGSVVTLSATVVALTLRDWHIGILALPIAMLTGVACGALNGLIYAYGMVPSFLVTLGTMFALDGISLMLLGGAPCMIMDRSYVQLATGNILSIPNLAYWSISVYVVTIIIGFKTKFGRYMYAIGGGERVAKLSGVPVKRFKFYAFMISGLLAGLAGALMASRIQAGTPRMGEAFLLESIAAVVMGGTALTGGVGGAHRTIIGVFIIGCLSNGMNVTAVDPYLQIVIKGLVVIGAVYLTLDRAKIGIMK